MKVVEANTPLAALAQALRSAARFNADVECAPHCILWPDKDGQWRPVIAALQAELPELLVLGDLDEAHRTGPAIWLRCAIAGELPSVRLPDGHPPILYLPGVGRQDLRAIENCPEHLKPLAELQYRGQIWSQANAKDWTALAFLKSSQGGLGLDVTQDREAKDALLLSLSKLMDEPLDVLRARRLDAAYFNTLLTGGDPIRDLLQWMEKPGVFRDTRGAAQWKAFASVCKSQFAFEPRDGELAAAAKLADRAGPWKLVWQRFAEAPQRYASIPVLIRRCPPPQFDMLADAESAGGWPQWNDVREADLHARLSALAEQPPHQAREQLLRLEREHRARRDLVWAELGEAPLADNLVHLAELARVTATSLAGGTLQELQAGYAADGWRADDAVLRALEYADTSANHAAITAAIRSVYLPWVEAAARHLQKLVETGRPPSGVRESKRPAYIRPDQCVLFVDGLRFDLARRLVERLQHDGREVVEQPVWTALPSVTATGKAAASPVSHRIAGQLGTIDFVPGVLDGAAVLSTHHFRKLLDEEGWQVLSGNDVGSGHGQAWCEFGDIDQEGHARGWKLAQHVDGLLGEIAERIDGLLAAGWSQVRVVTDHGWLLLPGGLPKIDLPKALADTKWGRCAAIKPGAQSDERLYPWYWNPEQRFALADGIACYKHGEAYAHGGLSLQECLTLQLTVTGAFANTPALKIEDAVWKGLRLVVSLETGYEGLSADIRRQAGDASTSVAVASKPFSTSGTCSMVVEDEDLEGHPAFLVILDEDNALLAQRAVMIGGGK